MDKNNKVKKNKRKVSANRKEFIKTLKNQKQIKLSQTIRKILSEIALHYLRMQDSWELIFMDMSWKEDKCYKIHKTRQLSSSLKI